MPAAFGRGRIFVTPENALRYWRRDLYKVDPNLFRAAEEMVKPGASVWDIGANVGLFTFAAANRAGTSGSVLAVEPDVDNLRLILRTRHASNMNCNAPIETLCAAISRPGERFATFEISVRSRSSNALAGYGGTQRGGVRERRTVPCFTLDELLSAFKPPTVLKIDVEGAEIPLLNGAAMVLERHRPLILVEVDPANSKQVGEILRGYRYRLEDADLLPGQRGEMVDAAWNCLATPL
jgi:FkbM family methyltransferase